VQRFVKPLICRHEATFFENWQRPGTMGLAFQEGEDMDGSVRGHFEDYERTTADEANDRARAADRCLQPVGDVTLEEVERCAYFRTHGGVPPEGSDVGVVREDASGRPAAALASNDEVIGLLPTRWNYLAGCLAQGYAYEGVITVAEGGNPAVVVVTLAPTNG
jgi:hypothetical protein